MRASLVFVLVSGCTAEPEACPAGALGCPCLADGECNAGFECADDGVCRDDEPLETETTIDPSTTSDDATLTSGEPTTTVEPTTTFPTTTFMPTTGPTDSGEATTSDPLCLCGWSDGQQFYTCGWDLPPEGPEGVGMPQCPAQGFLVGDACDAVTPAITLEGCCLNTFVAFCHPRTQTIELQECVVTELGCAPVG